MARATLELYSDLKCAGGVRLGTFHTGEVGSVEISIMAGGITAIIQPITDAFLGGEKGQVLRLKDALGTVREARITGRQDGWQDGHLTPVTLQAAPAREDLGRYLLRTESDGVTVFAFDDELTLGDWLSTYILPALALDGITFVSAGTIEPTQWAKASGSAVSVLQLVRILEAATKSEYDLVPDGSDTGYTIDFRARVGDTNTALVLHPQKNLIALERDDDQGQGASVLVPLGATRDSGEPATIRDHLFAVSAIATDTLTLIDPAGGDGPIQITDQFVGLFLRAADGSTTEIQSTAAPGTVEVDTGDGSLFAVGDLTRIVADATGAALLELVHPTLVLAPPDGLGRVVGVHQTDYRGEANYLRNPDLTDWAATGRGALRFCQADGGQTGTSIDMKNLPPGLEIAAGDNLWYKLNATQRGPNAITAPATVSGSGTVTLSLTTSITVVDDDIEILSQPEAGQADGWGGSWPYGYRYDRTVMAIAGVTVNGNHTGAYHVALTGFIEDDIVPVHAIVAVGATEAHVTAEAKADGAGGVVVSLDAPITASDTDPVSFSFEVMGEAGGDNALWMPYIPTGLTTSPAHVVDTPAYNVPFFAGDGYLWGVVGLTWVGGGGWGRNAAADFYIAPKLELFVGGSVVASVQDLGRGGTYDEPAVLGNLDFNLRCNYGLSADDDVFLRVTGPSIVWGNSGPEASGGDGILLRWAMVYVGTEELLPFINGAYADRTFASGNRALVIEATARGTWRATIKNLAATDSVSAEEPRIGGDAIVDVAALGPRSNRRIAGISFDAYQQERVYLLLEARPRGLTEFILAPLTGANA